MGGWAATWWASIVVYPLAVAVSAVHATRLPRIDKTSRQTQRPSGSQVECALAYSFIYTQVEWHCLPQRKSNFVLACQVCGELDSRFDTNIQSSFGPTHSLWKLNLPFAAHLPPRRKRIDLCKYCRHTVHSERCSIRNDARLHRTTDNWFSYEFHSQKSHTSLRMYLSVCDFSWVSVLAAGQLRDSLTWSARWHNDHVAKPTFHQRKLDLYGNSFRNTILHLGLCVT